MILSFPLEERSVGFSAHLSVPAAFESAFIYFERNLTSFQIIFYHPGRGEEAKRALERSFSWRSRKGNYYPCWNKLSRLIGMSKKDTKREM
jgi:hypothetical protein